MYLDMYKQCYSTHLNWLRDWNTKLPSVTFNSLSETVIRIIIVTLLYVTKDGLIFCHLSQSNYSRDYFQKPYQPQTSMETKVTNYQICIMSADDIFFLTPDLIFKLRTIISARDGGYFLAIARGTVTCFTHWAAYLPIMLWERLRLAYDTKY